MRRFLSHTAIRSIVAPVVVLIAGVAGIACNDVRDNPALRGVIEEELSRTLAIPLGNVAVGIRTLGELSQAEQHGLVSIEQIPADRQRQAITLPNQSGHQVKVTATPLLHELARTVGAARSLSRSDTRIELPIANAHIEEIGADKSHANPPSTPGLEYRSLAGTFELVPTAIGKTLGPNVVAQDAKGYRFRTVVRWSEMAKEWRVIAVDVGERDRDVWFSHNVK